MIVIRLAIAITTLFAAIQLVSAHSPETNTTSLTTNKKPTQSFSSEMDSVPGVRFVHVVRWDNLDGNTTYIDHPLTNGKPNAIVFITQNWNPGGIGGTYNNHPVGVWYNGSEAKWGIFNEDRANMVEGMAFNVLIPEPGPNVFVHEATAENTSTLLTQIDHPLTNNNPDAMLFITQNWNPGGGAGIYNIHPVGVNYQDGSTQKWTINLPPLDPFPLGAAFNVIVLDPNPNTFVHDATAGNIAFNSTYIDHPLANNNPNALLLFTNKGYYSYINNVNGAWYNSTRGQWAIFTQNIGNMSVGRSFNVTVLVTEPAFFVHKATATNILSNHTYIDHPLTNGNPNAIVFITQNWNPGGVGGAYNDHPIGVGYSTVAGKWAIFNQDLAAMPTGAAFNVLIPNVDTGVFVHHANAINTISSFITYIDYPLTNDRPNTIAFVTQNWNPGGVGGTYNNQPVGVWYRGSEDTWTVFNESMAGTLESAAFNVYIPIPNSNVFIHEATTENTANNYTCIDHPLANGNPNAVLHITHNFSPGGVASNFHDHVIGVFYRNSARKWCIFNQDSTSMPTGKFFNVIVGKSKIYLPLVMH